MNRSMAASLNDSGTRAITFMLSCMLWLSWGLLALLTLHTTFRLALFQHVTSAFGTARPGGVAHDWTLPPRVLALKG
jgi:hypothetical protein